MIAAGWRRAILVLAAWTMVAAATPYDDAARLYRSGKFLEAASLAATLDTASSLALAARATLAHAVYVADRSQRPAEVQRGAELAKKAQALDPGNVEGHLQLVLALYQQARAATAVGAYFQGYAEEVRYHLDTALRLDPSNPWAYSLLGGWHFEVVRLAGPMLAQNLFEANLSDGRAAFSKAIALMPRNIVLRYAFARALLLSDADTNRTEAVHALEAALAATPMNHLDKIIAARARTVLDAVNSGSPEALRQALDADGL